MLGLKRLRVSRANKGRARSYMLTLCDERLCQGERLGSGLRPDDGVTGSDVLTKVDGHV